MIEPATPRPTYPGLADPLPTLDSFPVDSFLITLEAFHTQQEVYDILQASLAIGSGVSVHEVNKLDDHVYRISIHVQPSRRYAGEQLVKDLLARALVEQPRDVIIDTSGQDAGAGAVTANTLAGIGKDLLTTLTSAGKAVGDAAGGVLGGWSVGTIVIVLGLGALMVGGLVLSRRAR
jgi:hypothetical protein